MKKFVRGPLIYLLLILAIFLVAQSVVNTDNQKDAVLGYTEFLKKVESGEITDITIVGYEAVALKKDTAIKKEAFPKKYDYYVYLPSYYQIDIDLKAALGVESLAQSEVNIVYQKVQDNYIWIDMI